MASLPDIADEIGGSIHDAFVQMDIWVTTVARRGHMTAGTGLSAMTASTSQALHLADPPGMRIFENGLINETAKKGR